VSLTGDRNLSRCPRCGAVFENHNERFTACPKHRTPKLDGSGRVMCSLPGCPFRSVPGKPKGGLCPYHWAADRWGKAWADNCYPNYTEESALAYNRAEVPHGPTDPPV
jgi:hypothetical protein